MRGIWEIVGGEVVAQYATSIQISGRIPPIPVISTISP